MGGKGGGGGDGGGGAAAAAMAAAAAQAAQIAKEVAEMNIEFLKEQSEIARADLEPFREAGSLGLESLQDIMGLKGPEAQQTAVDQVLQSPRVQTAINFGIEAIEKSKSARGMLKSGRIVEELQSLGQQVATSEIGAQQQALFAMTQIGQAAASGQATNAIQLGNAVAAENRHAGDIQANAALAAGQAQASAFLAQGRSQSSGGKGGGGLLGGLLGKAVGGFAGGIGGGLF